MNQHPDGQRSLDRFLLLGLFALFLLVSPVKYWWAAESSPWYTPYLLWLVVIAIALRLQRRRRGL